MHSLKTKNKTKKKPKPKKPPVFKKMETYQKDWLNMEVDLEYNSVGFG